VVASKEAKGVPVTTSMFQSPSLRGSGRFSSLGQGTGFIRLQCFNPLHCGAVVASKEAKGVPVTTSMFQSPSLRGSGRFAREIAACPGEVNCFNPLHCGAVVASGPTITMTTEVSHGFNPLHCGAVVASALPASSILSGAAVSIPFIAGQWSLQ